MATIAMKVALLTMTVIGSSCVGQALTNSAGKDPKVTLRSLPLNDDLSSLPFQKERVLIKANTYQYDLAALVGHALFLVKDTTGACLPASADIFDAIYISAESYLKTDAKLEPKTVNNVIYDHKVDNGASVSLSVFAFSATLSKDKLAQVTVTDAAFLNIGNNSLRPDYLTDIKEVIAQTGCPAILLLGAKVRVGTYRYFNKFAGSGSVGAAVFSANAQVYSEEALSRSEAAVSITPSLITRTTVGAPTPLPATDSTVFPRVIAVRDSAGFRKLDARVLTELRGRIHRP